MPKGFRGTRCSLLAIAAGAAFAGPRILRAQPLRQVTWRAPVETLKKYEAVTADLDPTQLYTGDFVPTDPEFIPPQNA